MGRKESKNQIKQNKNLSNLRWKQSAVVYYQVLGHSILVTIRIKDLALWQIEQIYQLAQC